MIKIYCRTTSKGKQTFYLNTGKTDYYLFMQDYRASNKQHFAKGQPLNDALDMKGVHSTATRKTIEKLLPAIRYVEKEYGITVLNGSDKTNKKRAPYKRERFSWTDLEEFVG